MDNVPSSAILAIIAILGAFIFSTVNSQQDAGNRALSQTEQMNTALDESKYTVYDGATVTGSQVLSAIKTFKGGEVGVAVDNSGGGTYTCYVRVLDGVSASETTATLGAAQSDSDYATAVKDAKDKTKSDKYITPAAQYTGSVLRDANNGAIVGLKFTKITASTTG